MSEQDAKLAAKIAEAIYNLPYGEPAAVIAKFLTADRERREREHASELAKVREENHSTSARRATERAEHAEAERDAAQMDRDLMRHTIRKMGEQVVADDKALDTATKEAEALREQLAKCAAQNYCTFCGTALAPPQDGAGHSRRR